MISSNSTVTRAPDRYQRDFCHQRLRTIGYCKPSLRWATGERVANREHAVLYIASCSPRKGWGVQVRTGYAAAWVLEHASLSCPQSAAIATHIQLTDWDAAASRDWDVAASSFSEGLGCCMGYAACNWKRYTVPTSDCSATWSAWATLHPSPKSCTSNDRQCHFIRQYAAHC